MTENHEVTDLEIIRKIRNASAHEGIGFSSAQAKIAAQCEALSLFEAWPESMRADRATPRLRGDRRGGYGRVSAGIPHRGGSSPRRESQGRRYTVHARGFT